jgi:ribose transport system permease protein
VSIVADIKAVRINRARLGDVPLAPIGMLIALVILFTISEPTFISTYSFQVVGANAAAILIFAIGETVMILTGRIDLSIGGAASLATVLVPKLVPTLHWFAIPVVILLFAFVGLAQGWIHLTLRLPSFVITIAGLFIWDGVALAITRGNELPLPFDNNPTTWLSGTEYTLGIPNSVITVAVVLLLASAALRWLPIGRRIYAIGVSERAAVVAGLSVRRTVLLSFAFSGACAALGGVILLATSNAGNSGAADGQLLPAITAVVIGGTAITGGSGGLGRTLIGALILAALVAGMTIAGWAPELQQVIYGVILIVAVLVTTNRKKVSVVK